MVDRREEAALTEEVGTMPASPSASVSANVANADPARADCIPRQKSRPRTCFELPFLKNLFDLLVYLLYSLRAIHDLFLITSVPFVFPSPPRI